MERKSLEELQNMVLEIMSQMKDNHNGTPEYKIIMMNLTTSSNELNSLRTKEITENHE